MPSTPLKALVVYNKSVFIPFQCFDLVFLFVREEKKDGYGNTCPFHCFGLVEYMSSHDDFPMNITWKLQQPAMAQYVKAI